MTPQNENQEVTDTAVAGNTKVGGTKTCRQCKGRCKLGNLDRCGVKPVFLDKDHPRYLEPCEVANPNNDCKEFRSKKTGKGE